MLVNSSIFSCWQPAQVSVGRQHCFHWIFCSSGLLIVVNAALLFNELPWCGVIFLLTLVLLTDKKQRQKLVLSLFFLYVYQGVFSVYKVFCCSEKKIFLQHIVKFYFCFCDLNSLWNDLSQNPLTRKPLRLRNTGVIRPVIFSPNKVEWVNTYWCYLILHEFWKNEWILFPQKS